ncbi:MAG TPA: ABC transporter permease [Alphaproteobacteria bacterium]|nr:ABC transporter permease [Alphaproteobacteria bacterium]
MEGLRDFWRRYRRKTSAVIGLALLVLVLVVALFGPLIVSGDPWDMATMPFLWPGADAAYPLGSDTLGRDILTGIIHGSRVSLLIGFSATVAALGIGVTVGALAGYFRGWIDDVLMRITEIFQTVPTFLLAVVLVAIFKPSMLTIVLAISAVTWPSIARLVRAEFLSLREREFVQSCVVIGMGETRIIFRQILPNCLPPIIVMSSVMVASAILTESGLSFLGLGDPNLMSWGTMIGIGREAMRTAWYMSAIPGVAILITVLALNLVGEGLNDALNPRLKNR